MRCLTLVVAISLVSCSHDFGRRDSAPELSREDQDSDGAVDLVFVEPPPDIAFREGGPFDLGFPDGCGPAGLPGSGSCATLGNWTCLTSCGGFDRLACNDGTTREIQCSGEGACQCKVGHQPPSPCLGMVNNGRTGCDRTREVFKQGCCKP